MPGINSTLQQFFLRVQSGTALCAATCEVLQEQSVTFRYCVPCFETLHHLLQTSVVCALPMDRVLNVGLTFTHSGPVIINLSCTVFIGFGLNCLIVLKKKICHFQPKKESKQVGTAIILDHITSVM